MADTNPFLDDLKGLEEETILRSEEARRKVSDSQRELEASGYDLSSSAAQTIASVTGNEAAQRVADRHKKVAAIKRENTDFTQSLYDVDSVGSALSYAHKTAIAAVPSIATAVAGGAVGVGVRGALATRSALASAMSPGAAAGTGAAAATYLPNTGEVFDAMREQVGPGGEDVAAGVVLGAGSTALDLLGVGRIARDIATRTAREAAGGVGRRAGTGALKTAGEEGVTEAAQNLLSEAGREIVDPEGYSFDKEAIKRTVESGVAGAIGGAGPGALSGATSRRSDRKVDVGPGGEVSPTPSADPVAASSDPVASYKGATTERLGPNGETVTDVDARAYVDERGTVRLREEAPTPTAPKNLLDTAEPRLGPNGEIIPDETASLIEGKKREDFENQSPKVAAAYEDHLRKLHERDRPDLVAKLPNAQSSDPTGARAIVPMGSSSLIQGDRADNLRLAVMPLELAKRSALERGARDVKGVPVQTKLEENWAESLSEAIKKGPESVTEFISGVRTALDKEMPKGPKNRTLLKNPRYQNAQRFGFFEKVATEYLARHQQLTNKTEQDLQQAQAQQVQQAAVQQQAQAQAQAQAQQEQADQEANLSILEKAMIGNEPKSMEHVIKSFKGLRAELTPQFKDAPVPPYILKIAEDVAREHATQQIASKVIEEQKKIQEENKKAAEAEQKAQQDAIATEQKNQAQATKDQLDIEKKAQDIAETEKKSKLEEKAAENKAKTEAKEADLKSSLEKKTEESKAKTENKTAVSADNSKLEKKISQLEKAINQIGTQNVADLMNNLAEEAGEKLNLTAEKVQAQLEKFTENKDKSVNTKFSYRTGPQRPSKVKPDPKLTVRPRERTKDQLEKIRPDLRNRYKEVPDKRYVELPDWAQAAHIDANELQNAVDSWTRGWENKPDIYVVDTKNLPDGRIGSYIKVSLEQDIKAGHVARGEFNNIDGKPTVILYSDFIENIDEGKGTLFHEALGHYGLKEYYGAELKSMLQDIYNKTPSIQKEVDALNKGYSSLNVTRATEEVLVSRLNSGRVDPSWEGLLRSLLRKFLKAIGWENAPLKYSNGELANILFLSQENVIKSDPRSAQDYEAGMAHDREQSLANIAKLPEALQPLARTHYNNVQSMAKRGLHMVSSLRDFVNANQGKLPSLKDYHKFMLERDAIARQMEEKLDQTLIPAKNLSKDKITQLSKVGNELSRLGEWPFQPTWRKEKVDVTAKATEMWNTLNDEQKKVLEGIFKFGHESLIARADAVKSVINQRLEGKIWDSLSPGEKSEVSKNVAKQLKLWDTKLNQVKGPYVPFSRFGNWAVVARSKEFMKLEEQVKNDGPKAAKEDIEKLDEMRMDEDHYRVMFRKSWGIAKEDAAKIKADPDYADMNVEAFEREAIYKQVQQAPWAGLQNMVETIKEELGSTLTAAQQRQIEDALKDVYFKALAENSTRRHLSKRRNVAGMSEDLLYSVAETGRSDASFTANVFKNKEITESINNMREERDTNNRERSDDRNDKSLVLNEVLHRHAMGMSARATPVIDTITGVTSFYFLLSAPRYYIQQLIQTPMVSMPYMAARFGVNETGSALIQSTKDLFASIPNMWNFAINGKFDTGTMDKDGNVTGKGSLKGSDGKALPTDEVQVINHFRQSGVLDVGLQHDLGSWENFGDNSISTHAKNALQKLKTITRGMEIGNRMTAGLAAYRLAKGKGMNYEDARTYAEKVLADTHGDYTAVDRPRLFGMAGSPGKLFFQFRRYSHAIASMLAKQTYTAFKGANDTEKRIARKVLTYMLGQTALVTGAMGLPMVSFIANVMAAAFGPDDEPTDADRWLRNAIGDDNIADILLKGIPNVAGLDLQSMLGMENVFRVAPFVEPDFTSRDKAASTIFYGLGGAFGGLVGRGADAMGHLSQGNFWKGMENLSPGVMRTASMAIREYNFGVTKKNGDQVMSPEEIGFAQALMRAMGIPTTQGETLRRERSDMFELDEYFKGRTSDLRREYVEARKEKDTDKQAELRDSWKALQEAKKRYNLTVSPLSNLLSAETQVKTREQRYKELLTKFAARN